MKLYTAKIVAGWLGLTERRVRQMKDEGILDEVQPGLYNLQACVRKYIDYLKEDVGGSLNDERARLTKAKREAVEMENEIMKGNLHRTADIETGLQTIILNIRSRFLALPAKLTPSLSGMGGDKAQIFDLLNSSIKEVLEELSSLDLRSVESEPDEPEDL